MTVKQLINTLQQYPEDATVRMFAMDEDGEHYFNIRYVEKFSIGEFSDPYKDYTYLDNDVILK